MPRFICKIPYDGEDYYLIYSSISDSFATYGTSLEEFNQYMLQREGPRYMQYQHPARMARVELNGTSDMDGDSVEELVICNRCGPQEEFFTMEQIIEKFIVGRSGHV